MKIRVTSLLALAALLAAAAPGGAQEDDDLARVKERELEAVREQISQLKERLDERAAERDRTTRELEQSELRIAEKRRQLKSLEAQKAASEERLAGIEARQQATRERLDEETAQLALQVRAAYLNGGQERLKLLLNQHDPATLGRQMVYYRYLSDYRGRNIEAVTAHLARLSGLRLEAEAEHENLKQLADFRYRELTELNAAQENRQELLASLKKKIEEDGSEIERLAAEEKDLTRLIAELNTILSDYPITSEEPFSTLRGQLTWPVSGQLLHEYGQPRAGGIKWNGVVLAAPRGREVRAVYHGRVVFADWLAGLGLLVIVDHGEGYMTLYGYNETTLKSAGDWVAPGDVLATVGDSGGQPRPGLYFELRKDTRPVDPRTWITRRPGAGS